MSGVSAPPTANRLLAALPVAEIERLRAHLEPVELAFKQGLHVHSDRFPLTQEFLGQMLGVRSASVNVAASILQKAGFIRYSRGVITILDRAGLESAACKCYRLIEAEYARLIG